MFSLSLWNLLKETLLLILSVFVVLLYPILFSFLFVIFIYRYVVQKVVSRDPKVFRILSGMDANLAAHNTYAPDCIVGPVYYFTSTVDKNQIIKVLNEKIFKPRDNNGKCIFPELTQKIVQKWGYNFWQAVDDFKVENHVRHVDERDPEKVFTKKGLENTIREELLKLPFNPEWSPWEIIIAKNYVDERDPQQKSAVMIRSHHALCDGYSMVKIMQRVSIKPWKELGGQAKTPTSSSRFMQNVVQFFLLLITAPYHVLKMAHFTNDDNEWARKASEENTDCLNVTVADPIPLSEIKSLKNQLKVSMSSVIMCISVEAALRTMARDNVYVDKIHIVLPFPLPDHPPNRLTNHWSMVKMPIAICKDNPLKTLQGIEKEFQKLRYSVAPLVNQYVSKLVGILPVQMIPKSEGLIKSTCILTNFPGPLHEIDMFGYKLRAVMVSASPPKGFAFVIASGSYNGELTYTGGGDACNFKDKQDMDFFAESHYDAFHMLRGDKEQNVVTERNHVSINQ